MIVLPERGNVEGHLSQFLRILKHEINFIVEKDPLNLTRCVLILKRGINQTNTTLYYTALYYRRSKQRTVYRNEFSN